MRFALPWTLLLLALVPALAALVAVSLALRRRRLERFASAGLLPRLLLGASTGRLVALGALRVVAIALIIIALARPQWGRRDEPVVRRGVDVVLALDLSASMLAEDVSPDRLEQARAEAVSLLGSLTGDRVALVTFGGRAAAICPLTADYGAVRLFLDAADASFAPGAGTDLGRAIEEAVRLLNSAVAEKRYKALVLLTDGEDLEGTAMEAVRQARESGVVIHAIGVGSPVGGPIPLRDDRGVLTGYKLDRQGKVVTTRFDPATLEKITLATDGVFLHAGPAGDAGAKVAEAISRMEKREISSRLATRFEDRYQIPLGVALVLLALEAAWMPRPRREKREKVALAGAAAAPSGPRAAARADAGMDAGQELVPGGSIVRQRSGRRSATPATAVGARVERRDASPSDRAGSWRGGEREADTAKRTSGSAPPRAAFTLALVAFLAFASPRTVRAARAGEDSGRVSDGGKTSAPAPGESDENSAGAEEAKGSPGEDGGGPRGGRAPEGAAPGRRRPGAEGLLNAGKAPSAAVARTNREGNRLYQHERYPEALSKYESAGAASPDVPALRYNIGNALARQGKYGEAASEYQRALRSADPGLAPAIRYNLGNSQFLQGRYKDAAESYLKVLEKKPQDEAARRNLELALRALKQAEQQKSQSQDQKKQEDQKNQKQEQQAGGAGEPKDQKQAQRDEGRDGSSQDRAQGREGEKKNAGKGARAGEQSKIDPKEAERLLDSMAEEEKKNLKQRLARQPRETGPEKDW